MDIPSEIIEAVKETKADLVEPKRTIRASKHDKQKRILNALGNGLRTTESIANATSLDQKQVGRALFSLIRKGFVLVVKKEGVKERKYYLNTEKPSLGKGEIAVKKRKYTKRKLTTRIDKVNPVATPKAEQTMLNRYIRELEMKLHNITGKLALLETALAEKDKEVWTLECEVFDKKAVIKYLEEKLFAKGTI